MKNDAQLFKWTRKMVLTDSIGLMVCFWLFWTNFGSVLDYLWAKLGLQYPILELLYKKNALLFNWSRKMVLTDSVDQIMCFWLFLANFGPILVQFRPKMAKYDPVKPVSKIFM